VDSAQYQKRTQSFDFDMVVTTWGQSSSPGNEQRMYWTSNAAGRIGSRNLSGLKNNVVDELVEGLIAASDRKKLVAHSQALDRVLLWQHLVIPHWHTDNDRIVYWNRFGMPVRTPKNGIVFSAWWIDPKKDLTLRRAGYGATMREGR
jgi:microcin C transport system substrate-binding protein